MTTIDYNQRLVIFLEALQEKLTKIYNLKDMPHLAPILSVNSGKKYDKIVSQQNGNKSVYCFIEKSNGDILKAATWNAPAKTPRGNIWNANMLDGCTQYGAEYLR